LVENGAEETSLAALRFRAQLLDAVAQAIIATDVSGRIVYWNAAAEALYGWRADEVLGRQVLDVTVAEPSRVDGAEIMTRLQRGETWSGEFLVRRRDGTTFSALVTDSPVFDAAGHVTGIVGISVDLTERDALLIAERRARAAAEAAVRTRDRVLTSVAHDAKTPLTAIRGYAQLLARGIERLDPESIPAAEREGLHIAAGQTMAAAIKMARWIDELSDLARLQIGQPLPLHRQQVDLVAVANQIVQEYCQTDPWITCRLRTSIPSLVGNWDQGRLERVLGNIVGNAVKYSPRGGTVIVQIDVGTAPAAPGETTGPTVARIEVRDEGVGIPADDLPHIFELFRRGANVPDSVGGSGIGLASARYIVQHHGGSIAVESEEGRGTSVIIRLPL
jgi:PAS domain S-box-containing protein